MKKEGLIPEIFLEGESKDKNISKTYDIPDSSDDDIPRNPNYSTDSDDIESEDSDSS